MYDSAFYRNQEEGSLASARKILPRVFEIVQPSSVLDVGCGLGTWVKACVELGVSDALGVDGNYVNQDQLHCDRERFTPGDVAKPFTLNRSFDLVMSLEVAEHIPEERAEYYLDNITSHGDVVLFGAAVPHFGGKHHVNEQWQSYWVNKFDMRGYKAIDCVRAAVWNEPSVEWWYKQDTFLFVKTESALFSSGRVSRYDVAMPFDLVHPALFEGKADPRKMSVKNTFRHLPVMVLSAARRLSAIRRPRQ